MTTENHNTNRLTTLLILALCLILIGLMAFCGWVFLQRMARLYTGHIYPNVYALDVPLGALTPTEAAAALTAVSAQVDAGLLILTDGAEHWSYDWSEAGMYVDVAATTQAAYHIGREGGWRAQAEIWLTHQDVAPRFAFDAVAAHAVLEQLSQAISQPPVEPTLHLEQGAIHITPGEAGRVLDVSNTLAQLQSVGGDLERVQIPLVFNIVPPAQPDIDDITAQVEALLARTIVLSTYDVLTDETFNWTLDEHISVDWLHLIPGPDAMAQVDVNLHAIHDTLFNLSEDMGEGRAFYYDDVAKQILATFDAGGGDLDVYLTHPERLHTIRAGETLMKIGTQYGMPSGLIIAANPDINPDQLSVGQVITVPSQDILTPYLPARDKKIVVSLAEQRARVYENEQLLHEWTVSTGIKESPTHAGVFQVLEKYAEAYASQWDLWMPYFIAVYPAGGGVQNGFHELPILASGSRLWAGSLGQPASFGCIILGIPDAETLYNWAEVGVVVIIE